MGGKEEINHDLDKYQKQAGCQTVLIGCPVTNWTILHFLPNDSVKILISTNNTENLRKMMETEGEVVRKEVINWFLFASLRSSLWDYTEQMIFLSPSLTIFEVVTGWQEGDQANFVR